jgi:hypothetical protein
MLGECGMGSPDDRGQEAKEPDFDLHHLEAQPPPDAIFDRCEEFR